MGWQHDTGISSYFDAAQASTFTINATQHNKPGLHAVCGEYHSVLGCKLFSNARYEKLQIDLWVGGFMLIHLVQNVILKQNRPSSLFSFSFSVYVSTGGGDGVYRWVPGWGSIPHIGRSTETLKNKQKKQNSTPTTLPILYLWILYEALIDHCVFNCRSTSGIFF